MLSWANCWVVIHQPFQKGRFVPVIIPQECRMLLDFIASETTRRQAGIREDSPYLFSSNRKTSYITLLVLTLGGNGFYQSSGTVIDNDPFKNVDWSWKFPYYRHETTTLTTIVILKTYEISNSYLQFLGHLYWDDLITPVEMSVRTYVRTHVRSQWNSTETHAH